MDFVQDFVKVWDHLPMWGRLLYVAVVLGLLGLVMMAAALDAEKPRTKPDNWARRYERTCPYCGGVATRWETFIPHHFRCSDCLREFGDALMTEEERAQVAEIDVDCARAENLPNLDALIHAAYEKANRCQHGMICMNNGEMVFMNLVVVPTVVHAANDPSAEHWLSERRCVIGRYSGLTTAAGQQHLAKLCAEHCLRRGAISAYKFMSNGIIWPDYEA